MKCSLISDGLDQIEILHAEVDGGLVVVQQGHDIGQAVEGLGFLHRVIQLLGQIERLLESLHSLTVVLQGEVDGAQETVGTLLDLLVSKLEAYLQTLEHKLTYFNIIKLNYTNSQSQVY